MAKLKKMIGKGVTENYLLSDIDDVRENLVAYGVDIEKNAMQQSKLIKQLKFKLKSSINKRQNEELLNKATENFKEAIVKGLDKPVAYLNNLISQNGLAFNYSNLDKLSTQEIEEIIKDQNLLEIIELLEEE